MPIAGVTFTGAVTFDGAFTSQGIDDNANATAITIDSSENVGIGTSSPSQAVHLSNASTAYYLAETTGTGTSAGLRVKGGASADYTLFTTQGTNQFAIYDNAAGAERMRIGSSGLHQFKGELETVNATMVMRFRDASEVFKAGIQAVNSAGQMVAGSVAGDFAFRSQGDLLFSAGGNVEAMRISSAGVISGDGSGLTGVGASTTYGAVGTYFAGFLEVSALASGGYNAGATVSGSLLKYSLFGMDNPNDSSYVFESVINTSNGFVSAGLSGTWRMMSGPLKWRDPGKSMSSLFVRIS
jgi:hypothetical protein